MSTEFIDKFAKRFNAKKLKDNIVLAFTDKWFEHGDRFMVDYLKPKYIFSLKKSSDYYSHLKYFFVV